MTEQNCFSILWVQFIKPNGQPFGDLALDKNKAEELLTQEGADAFLTWRDARIKKTSSTYHQGLYDQAVAKLKSLNLDPDEILSSKDHSFRTEELPDQDTD